MKGYQVQSSQNSVPWSDHVDNFVLSAGVAQQFAIPSGYTSMSITANADIWVKVGTNPTAAVPAANVTDGSGSILNPVTRNLNGEAKVSLISAVDCKGSIEYYK